MMKVLYLLVSSIILAAAVAEKPQICSLVSEEKDPALKEMIYDVGDGPKSFLAYVEPPFESFYNGNPPSKSRVVPEFNGLAGKFINMSNKPLNFYWEASKGGAIHLMRHYKPFSTGGTGTFPGHRFFFAPENDPKTRVKEFVIEEYPQNYYYYDPYYVEGDPVQTEKNLNQSLNKTERKQYDKWKKTLSFNQQYQNFTGRSYLSNYGDEGPRKPPSHFMWPADYFGQEHWVITKETHFNRLPPAEDLEPILITGSKRVLKDDDPRVLQEYRVQDQPFMNMTLTVKSVIPRVFEIPNFLSQVEVEHIVQLAGGIELRESTTGDVGTDRGSSRAEGLEKATKTRTSFNSWVPREKSPILDAIYRRAADLTRIDEALLRSRDKNEYPDVPVKSKLCEELQLVYYGPTQEYTAHHDFGYTHIDDNLAGARFATILFYLNEGMEGGHTSFPRYVNGETFHELVVKPEAGKAVLFYSQLPDGNMDDFSQHSAKPVIEGEKWLINLWIWDPVKDNK